MKHTAIILRYTFLALFLILLPLSAAAQETRIINVAMDNGDWHEWNEISSDPAARSWYSTDTSTPRISVCSRLGSTLTHNIRNKTLYGTNNMSVWNENYFTFSSDNGSYEITVADGWHIKAVAFDFNGTTEDVGTGVKLNNEDEVISTGPSDTKHVATTIADDITYTIRFTVSNRGSAPKAIARTSNFNVTVARDLGLEEAYILLMADAKLQLSGALKISNARAEITGGNLINTASQLSSPNTETNEGSIEALLDGDPTTFWNSTWMGGSVPNHSHYLQVDLTEPKDISIAMTFTRRQVMNDHITVWSVYGSNDPNASEWNSLSYLYTPYTNNNETIECLPFNASGYRYLRFYIDGTTTNRGYGHMSEFQLNPANLVKDPSISFFDEAVELGYTVGRLNLLNSDEIDQSQYDELKESYEALRAKFVYSFEVGGIYYKVTSLSDPSGPTVAVSYQGATYDWYNNEYSGNVTIPETVTFEERVYNVTSIDERAFYGCPGLTSITIPATITTIGRSAFDNCDNLTSVTVGYTTPLELADATFSNRANAILYVPNGYEAVYAAAPYWQEFKQINEVIEMLGDVNEDGVVDLNDKQTIIEWILAQQDDNAYEEKYDVNDDGVVDVRDALRILEIIAE